VRLTVLIVVLVTGGAAVWAAWPRDASKPPDACGPVDQPPQRSGASAAGQATICLLNRRRAQQGLPPLRQNSLLSQASLEHSEDMVRGDYFEHTAPDGRTVGDRLRAVGYQRGVTASAGENIAYGVASSATPAAIVDKWMHSPPHRADIMRAAFTEIGIGIALGAPDVARAKQSQAATYTTDFGGVFDPSLPSG